MANTFVVAIDTMVGGCCHFAMLVLTTLICCTVCHYFFLQNINIYGEDFWTSQGETAVRFVPSGLGFVPLYIMCSWLLSVWSNT